MSKGADSARSLTICVVGKSGVGKTTAIIKYVNGYFAEGLDATLFDDYTCTVTSSKTGINYVLKIKDTAGQDEYKELRLLCYNGASAIILCYSIDDREGLQEIRNKWMPELRDHAKEALNVPVTLAAFKCDLRTSLNADESKYTSNKAGRQLAKELNAQYVECSAKDDKIGVELAFLTVISNFERPPKPEKSSNPIVRFFRSIWSRITGKDE